MPGNCQPVSKHTCFFRNLNKEDKVLKSAIIITNKRENFIFDPAVPDLPGLL